MAHNYTTTAAIQSASETIEKDPHLSNVKPLALKKMAAALEAELAISGVNIREGIDQKNHQQSIENSKNSDRGR